jgi:hypothetical protein
MKNTFSLLLATSMILCSAHAFAEGVTRSPTFWPKTAKVFLNPAQMVDAQFDQLVDNAHLADLCPANSAHPQDAGSRLWKKGDFKLMIGTETYYIVRTGCVDFDDSSIITVMAMHSQFDFRVSLTFDTKDMKKSGYMTNPDHSSGAMLFVTSVY